MKFLERLQKFEPAVLRGIYVAIVAVLGAAGLVLTPAVEANAAAIVGGIIAIIAIVQGVLTRMAVYPPAVVEELSERTGEEPLTSAELQGRESDPNGADDTVQDPGGDPEPDVEEELPEDYVEPSNEQTTEVWTGEEGRYP